jgi:hypothetical protein
MSKNGVSGRDPALRGFFKTHPPQADCAFQNAARLG